MRTVGDFGYDQSMRAPADAAKVRRFIELLGKRARSGGRVYLTGGASALLVGWRASTADIDIKLSPEPEGTFEAIAKLKNELDLNVELAAPDDFLPPVPGWEDASVFIDRVGLVDFFHYDFRGQALSKIARHSQRDLADVQAMLERDLVNKEALRQAFESIRQGLIRYPALDESDLEAKLNAVLDATP